MRVTVSTRTTGPEGMIATAVLDRVVEDAGCDRGSEGRTGRSISERSTVPAS